MSDPTVVETDRLRRRIAELEQVVRDLRQRNPARNTQATQTAAEGLETPYSSAESDDKGQNSKKRRVIVDRFARFKLGEAAMAALSANGSHSESGDGTKATNEKAELYETHSLPGEEMVSDSSGRKTFLGAAAGKSMLRKVGPLPLMYCLGGNFG